MEIRTTSDNIAVRKVGDRLLDTYGNWVCEIRGDRIYDTYESWLGSGY